MNHDRARSANNAIYYASLDGARTGFFCIRRPMLFMLRDFFCLLRTIS
jgi:hypothetical protein